MPTQIRIPYYILDFSGFFALQRAWTLFDKLAGCKPLDNPQAAILMERKPPPLPGEKTEQIKEAKQANSDPKSSEKDSEATGQPSTPFDAPDVRTAEAFKASNDLSKAKPAVDKYKTPPPFDMLDLPEAMEKMGWPVAAKLTRRWFNSRKHEIPNDRHYIYPDDMVDTSIVSLDFILKYTKAREKYNQLINKEIYTDFALDFLRKQMNSLLSKKFMDNNLAYSGELDTLAYSGNDMQKLHRFFRFQDITVTNFDTLDSGFGLTELTASLANFSLMAAVANARIYTEKYYNYPKGAAPVFCCQSHIEVTHIYVYAKDSYSFVDKPGQKASQYLGHWNRNGVILVPAAVLSDLLTHRDKDVQWGNGPYMEDGFDMPVDVLKGMLGEMRKRDVYYPVRNSDYQKWREKFGRGGDFIIYTQPKKIKLPNPIKFTSEETCKTENMAHGK